MKKQILKHCIEILYEQLLMVQIEEKSLEKWFEERGKSVTAQYEYQEQKVKTTRLIDFLSRKIESAQQMLEEETE